MNNLPPINQLLRLLLALVIIFFIVSFLFSLTPTF